MMWPFPGRRTPMCGRCCIAGPRRWPEGSGNCPPQSLARAAVSAAVCSDYTEWNPNGQPTSGQFFLFGADMVTEVTTPLFSLCACAGSSGSAFVAPGASVTIATPIATVLAPWGTIEVRTVPRRAFFARLDRLRLHRRHFLLIQMVRLRDQHPHDVFRQVYITLDRPDRGPG